MENVDYGWAKEQLSHYFSNFTYGNIFARGTGNEIRSLTGLHFFLNCLDPEIQGREGSSSIDVFSHQRRINQLVLLKLLRLPSTAHMLLQWPKGVYGPPSKDERYDYPTAALLSCLDLLNVKHPKLVTKAMEQGAGQERREETEVTPVTVEAIVRDVAAKAGEVVEADYRVVEEEMGAPAKTVTVPEAPIQVARREPPAPLIDELLVRPDGQAMALAEVLEFYQQIQLLVATHEKLVQLAPEFLNSAEKVEAGQGIPTLLSQRAREHLLNSGWSAEDIDRVSIDILWRNIATSLRGQPIPARGGVMEEIHRKELAYRREVLSRASCSLLVRVAQEVDRVFNLESQQQGDVVQFIRQLQERRILENIGPIAEDMRLNIDLITNPDNLALTLQMTVPQLRATTMTTYRQATQRVIQHFSQH